MLPLIQPEATQQQNRATSLYEFAIDESKFEHHVSFMQFPFSLCFLSFSLISPLLAFINTSLNHTTLTLFPHAYSLLNNDHLLLKYTFF